MPTEAATPAPVPPGPDRPLRQEYREIWTAAALQVIHQLSGDDQWQAAADAAPRPSSLPIDLAAHWELSGTLAGKLSLKFHRDAARAWARLLAAGYDPNLSPAAVSAAEPAPARASDPLDAAEQEALTEALRQLAVAVTAGLSAGGWGEVQVHIRHLGPLRRTVEGADGEFPLHFSHPAGGMLELDLVQDSALRDQVRRGPRLNPGRDEAAAPDHGPAHSVAKLDLLLDVELDVTLRFGGRQMLLHDVLELAPGSVLELDRHIDDPVELLVGGKIIAWGEVVVVDGNYGLRITRLVHRRDRMAAVGAAQ